MEEKKFSLNSVVSGAINSTNGKCRKIFAVSIMQYMAFLLVYLLTGSAIISFSVYAIFLPNMVAFLSDLENSKAEMVFKVGKNFLTSLLISLLFIFTFGIGLLLLIFPGIIIFANYALVFEEAKNGDTDVLSAFKDAKSEVKGYRGQMTLLCLSFFLIAILLVGFCILLCWLFSLFVPVLTYDSAFILSFINIPLFYYLGTFLGASIFLIFVLPVELIAVSKMKEAIAQDKLYKENHKEEPEGNEKPAAENSEAKEEQSQRDDLKDSEAQQEVLEEPQKSEVEKPQNVDPDYIS